MNDFVMYFRDSKLNEPSGFQSRNEYNEQAILINFLVDMKTQQKLSAVIDSDQTSSYSELCDSISEMVDTTAISDEAQLEDEERKQAKIRNNEYIFLIDRSGSMNGVPIQLAVKALKVFLHSLPMGCLFNVYSFGSKYEVLFPESMEYTQDSLEMAVDVISSFSADMGGTEIFQVMKNIFSNPPKTNKDGGLRERHLFLLTDGAVANTHQVIDLIKTNSENTKVHTFGIGSGAST